MKNAKGHKHVAPHETAKKSTPGYTPPPASANIGKNPAPQKGRPPMGNQGGLC